jgi:hypothetical protein
VYNWQDALFLKVRVYIVVAEKVRAKMPLLFEESLEKLTVAGCERKVVGTRQKG